jgi:hypothetical protein
LLTHANTYSPLACTAGLAVAELAVLLYPALAVPLKLTDFTRTAPLAIPARATTATVRVLDFMIILPFCFQARRRPHCARARCDQAL